MKKPKKVKRKTTLRERLLRRWRNSSLKIKELSRMEFGKTPISKTIDQAITGPTKEAIAATKALYAMAQAAISTSPLNALPFGPSLLAQQQANMNPLGRCQCSVCYPRLGRRGIGRFFSGLF